MKDGVLLIDKPGGMTSTDVLRRLRRPLGTRKLGHAGTLDPMATGVLVVGVNAATRLIPWLMAGRKRYLAEILLGTRTTTDDVEGDIIAHQPVPDLDDATILRTLERFTGTIAQVPPAFSAIHVDGERAHRMARRGEDPVLPPREVKVHELQLSSWSGDRLVLDCDVGKGTYIRALARDIGASLGCGGTLATLRRTESQPFSESDTTPLDQILADDGSPPLISMWDALPMLPAITASAEEGRALAMGQRRRVPLERIVRPVSDAHDPGLPVDGMTSPAIRVGLTGVGLLAIATLQPVEDDPGHVELKPARVFRRPEELPGD